MYNWFHNIILWCRKIASIVMWWRIYSPNIVPLDPIPINFCFTSHCVQQPVHHQHEYKFWVHYMLLLPSCELLKENSYSVLENQLLPCIAGHNWQCIDGSIQIESIIAIGFILSMLSDTHLSYMYILWCSRQCQQLFTAWKLFTLLNK